jgi:uncharacterized SAM-binding protein YcdF (DUF218 family)
MTSASEAGARSHPRRSGLFILVPLSLVVALLAAVLFLGVGRWLVVEDPLEKAQAIVVLSGRIPLRAVEAARLYRAGCAPQIWLTRPEEPTASLAAYNIAYPGEDVLNAQVLVHEGVPSNAIVVLPPSITNTADEVRAIAGQLDPQKRSTLIIVTTKAHTRRVRRLWNALAGGRGRAIIRAASGDPFEPARWWRTSGDALDVVREVLGLLNAWAGLPLRPAS